MTYNVFGGTLSLTQSINHFAVFSATCTLLVTWFTQPTAVKYTVSLYQWKVQVTSIWFTHLAVLFARWRQKTASRRWRQRRRSSNKQRCGIPLRQLDQTDRLCQHGYSDRFRYSSRVSQDADAVTICQVGQTTREWMKIRREAKIVGMNNTVE